VTNITYSVKKCLNEIIKNKETIYRENQIYNFNIYVKAYLNQTNDFIRHEEHYEPITKNFVTLKIGMKKIIKIIENLDYFLSINTSDEWELVLYSSIFRECLNRGKEFNISVLKDFSSINSIKNNNQEYFNLSKLTWIDFCLSVALKTRNDIWNVEDIYNWYLKKLDQDMKTKFDFNEILEYMFESFNSNKEQFYTLKETFKISNYLINKLKRMSNNKFANDPKNFKLSLLTKQRIDNDNLLNLQQKDIIKNCLLKPLFVNGVAGTGKTTTIAKAAIYLKSQVFKKNARLIILSFTGKSVVSIKDKITLFLKSEPSFNHNWDVRTIHKELADIQNKNKKVFYIIDEASMIPTTLLYSLLMKKNVMNISFFGDANQLPPIAGPSPFTLILNSLTIDFCRITLKKNYRDNERELKKIKELFLNNINLSNKYPFIFYLNQKFKGIEDFIIGKKFALKISEDIKKLKSEKSFLFYRDKNMLITPRNVEVEKLNAIVHQELLRINNYNKKTFIPWFKDKTKKLTIFPGTKLIFTRFNYYMEDKLILANGEIGVVMDTSVKKIANTYWLNIKIFFTKFKILNFRLKYWFDVNGEIKFKNQDEDFKIFLYFDLAYCLTIHKAQGSEYDNVLCYFFYSSITQEKFYIPEIESDCFWSKNLVYVAISRAKKRLKIYCRDSSFLELCLENDAKKTKSYIKYIL